MAEIDDDQRGIIGDMVRIGTVASVDLAAARVTVACGDVTSPPCPWLELAGGFRSWVPPVVDEQVVLLCPEGDIAGGLVLRGVYSDSFPAPLSTATARFLMPDGATIDYDPAVHKLTVTLPAGSVDIVADVNITGDVNVTGTITASEDVVGDGISLKSHTHGGVQAGSAQTGNPQ